MRRVNILGVEISAVNKETAIQYLLENMDKARGKYICACNVHTTVTAHENLDYQAVQNNSFMTLPDGKLNICRLVNTRHSLILVHEILYV